MEMGVKMDVKMDMKMDVKVDVIMSEAGKTNSDGPS